MAEGQQHIHEGAMVALRSVHGKYLSAQPDGRAMWDRPWASTWEYFHVERRQNGKITLKGAHGMYLSAQLDGGVQINRGAAPPGGWEEFTVEGRGNDVVCLKSCHGKYLSAQQDGTAQWNRDHAPRGGWEDIQFMQQDGTDQAARGQQQPATNTISVPPTIEILAATEGKPVRFRINGPPNSRSAWVGIYPSGAEDQDHGDEGERWKWLRDIDVKRASFPEKSEGRWSMRVFSDGGFTLDERVDFDILPEKERWWED